MKAANDVSQRLRMAPGVPYRQISAAKISLILSASNANKTLLCSSSELDLILSVSPERWGNATQTIYSAEGR